MPLLNLGRDYLSSTYIVTATISSRNGQQNARQGGHAIDQKIPAAAMLPRVSIALRGGLTER